MTGYNQRTPMPGTRQRLALEQSIACGWANHRLMLEYGISYEQLRCVVDGMNDDETAPPRRPPSSRASVHGTAAAYSTHQRKKEHPCLVCVDGHVERLAARAASRQRANAAKRLRGVA